MSLIYNDKTEPLKSFRAESQIRRITPECQPVFPCWRFHAAFKKWHYCNTSEDGFNLDSHWHPDQPSAPTEIPAIEEMHSSQSYAAARIAKLESTLSEIQFLARGQPTLRNMELILRAAQEGLK